MGKRTAQRIGMPVQLKTGEDDDLIKWYTALEKGTRQEHVKRLLRLALGIEPKPAARLQPVTLQDLQQIMLQQQREMFDLVSKEMDKMESDLMTRVRDMLENMGTYYHQPSTLQPVEYESAEVDEETLRRRAENMAQEDW